MIKQDHVKSILRNQYKIEANESGISENRKAIDSLKSNFVPYEVFENAIEKYDKIVHRLILVVCGIVALLFVCNAVWLYAWNKIDFGDTKTTITQEGGTNSVGGTNE